MSSRNLLNLNWTPESIPTAWGLIFIFRDAVYERVQRIKEKAVMGWQDKQFEKSMKVSLIFNSCAGGVRSFLPWRVFFAKTIKF